MSPRSGYWQQLCPCGTNQRASTSVTLAGSTLRLIPRQKSRAITVYICDSCLKDPKPKTRRRLIEAVLSAAIEAKSAR